MFGFLDEEDVRELVRGYVDSREWWIIVCAVGTDISFMETIENKFYAGEASKDFEVVLLPTPLGLMTSLAFANKRRMSRDELNSFLETPAGDDKDILFPASDPVAAEAAGKWFYHFVTDASTSSGG